MQEHGAAYETGGLEVGQLILEVDSEKVEGMQHQVSLSTSKMKIMQIFPSSILLFSSGCCSPHSGMLCKSWSKWDHIPGCWSKEIKSGAKANGACISRTIASRSSVSEWFLKSATNRHRLNTLDKAKKKVIKISYEEILKMCFH